MPREIDEKVVKLEFDNKDFEKNTKQSLDSIEKLKESLKFDGAKQGFDDINRAEKKIGFKNTISGLDTLCKKFSTMEIIGITSIANITNSILNFGKKTLKSLTIDQVTASWQKYEDKTSAVQTIMSAVRKDFESEEAAMEAINEQMDRLVWFTDETSYSLTDMTNNMGKFVANNVPLKESATAMQGVSVWAAASGQNAATASRAMMNLSQALSTGTVRLQDWMSIENANMATAEFKQLVIDTAKELGVLNKSGGFKKTTVTAENFRNTLSEGWFNKDVLNAALEKYGRFADILYTATEKTGLSATDMLAAIDEYKAAAAGLAGAGKEIDSSLGDIAKRVMKGEFGNGAQRRGALEAMGLDPDAVQEEVNRIKSGLKASEESISVLPKSLADIDTGNLEVLGRLAEQTKMSVEDLKVILDDLSSSENELGYNAFKAAQEAKTFSDALGAIKDGVSTAWTNLFETIFGDYLTSKKMWTKLANWGYDVFAEPINKITEATQRLKDNHVFENLREGFKNIKEYVNALIGPFREVFKEQLGKIFKIDAENIGKLTEKFKDWTSTFKVSEEKAEKIRNTASKISGILDKITGKGSKIKDFLWGIVKGSFSKVFSWIKKAVSGLKSLKASIKDSKTFDRFFKAFSKVFSGVKGLNWQTLTNLFTNLKVSISSFLSGLEAGNIKTALSDLGNGLTSWFTPVDDKSEGIRSGLKDFFNSVNGTLKDFGGELSNSWEIVKQVIQKISEFLLNGGLGGILGLLFGRMIFKGLTSFAGVIERWFVTFEDIVHSANDVLLSVKGMFDSIKTMFTTITGMFTSVTKYIDKKAAQQTANNFLKIAAAIVLIVGAIYALTVLLPEEKNKQLIVASAVVAGVMLALTLMMNRMNKISKDKNRAGNIKKIAASILMIGASLAIIVISLLALTKLFDATNTNELVTNLIYIVSGVALISLVLNRYADDFNKGSFAILLVAGAVLILTSALSALSKLDSGGVVAAGIAIGICLAGLAGVVAAIGKSKATGKAILATSTLSLSIIFFVQAIKNIIKLVKTYITQAQIEATFEIIFGCLATIAAFMFAIKHLGIEKGAKDVGISVLAMSAAMILLAFLLKRILNIKGNLDGAFIVIAGLSLVVGLLVAALRIAGDGIKASTKGVIGLAIAVGLLGLVAVALGQIKIAKLAKGVLAVSGLVISLATAIRIASKEAGNIQFKSLIAMGGVMLAMAVMTGIFSLIPFSKLGPAVASMSLIMVTLGYALKQAGQASEALKVKSVAGIIAILTAIAAALVILNVYIKDPSGAIKIAVALSMLMLSLSAVLVICSKIGNAKFGPIARGVAGLLMVMVALVALAGSLWVIDKIGVNDTLIPTVFKLVGLLAVLNLLSAEMALIGLAGIIGLASAASGLGMVALALVSLIAVAGALWVIDKMNIGGCIPIAKELIKITAVLGALSIELGVLGLLALSGGFLMVAAGLGAIVEVLLGLMVLSLAMSALGSVIEATNALDKMDSVIAFSEKLGKTLGAFISGIVDKGTEGLVSAGEHIGQMWDKMSPFVEGINASAGFSESMKDFADGMKTLTESGILNKIADFFGDSAFTSLGNDLRAFAENLAPLAELGSNKNLVTGATAVGNLGDAVKNFGDYNKSLTSWTTNLPEFISMMAGLPDINTETIDHIVEAARKLKELIDSYNEIMSSGQTDTPMLNFGSAGVEGLASQIGESKAWKWVEEKLPAAADAASTGAEKLTGAFSLFGGSDGTNTATNLLSFGNSINSFASGMDAFLSLDTSNIAQLKSDLEALKPMIKDFVTDNKSSDFKKKIGEISDGISDLNRTFSDKSIAEYANVVSQALFDMRTAIEDFSSNTDTNGLTTKINAIKDALSNVFSNDSSIGEDAKKALLEKFQNGGVLAAESSKESISASMTAVSGTIVQEFFQYMGEDITLGLPGFFDEIGNKMVEAVNGLSSLYGHVGSTAAKIFLSGMHTHINDAPKEVSSFSEQVVSSIASAFEGNEIISSGLSTAGVTLGSALSEGFASLDYAAVGTDGGQGIINGLESKIGAAYSAGYALGAAAVAGANAGLDNHSPSHLLFKSGVFGGMGLINGLKSMFSSVHRTGTKMGEEAVDSINAVISTVSKAMSSDSDMQPVIRPVVDLSNVEKSAGAVSGMFGHRVSIGSESYNKAQKVSFLYGDSNGIQNGSSGGPTYVNNNNIYPQQLNNSTVDYMFNLFDSRLGAKV